MPELPEVETTRAGISSHITGQCISYIIVRQRQLRWPISTDLSCKLPGQTIHDVKRRGKYLLIATEKGHICLHLGMTGRLYIAQSDIPPGKHDHFDIVFHTGQALRFNDARRFGSVFWLEGDPEQFSLIARLGPEPWDPVFNGQWLKDRARNRRIAVKNFIMDAAIVVGVGNIYASEALFAAGIHPRRPAGRISVQRYTTLCTEIRKVLEKAIAAGGTTLQDFLNSDGQAGYFQQFLRVYGQTNETCPRGCGPIKCETIGQRSTFYCPVCQT